MADFTAGRAAYLQIADEFKRKIRDGELAPGDKLPSEAELMTKHGVSRTVARQAISRLREDGYAISHQARAALPHCPVTVPRRSAAPSSSRSPSICRRSVGTCAVLPSGWTNLRILCGSKAKLGDQPVRPSGELRHLFAKLPYLVE